MKYSKTSLIISASVLIVMIGCLFCSCKATPENEIITKKNSKAFNEAILQTADLNDINCLEYYSDNFSSGDNKVSITIAAEVSIPDEDKLPVILIEREPITNTQVQWAVDSFLEGSDGSYSTMVMTKSDIESWIIKLQAKLENEEELYQNYSTEKKVEIEKENLNKRIQYFKEMLLNAPENIERIPSELTFRPFSFYTSYDSKIIENELEISSDDLQERQEQKETNLYLSCDTVLSDGRYTRLEVYNECPSSINEGIESVFHMEKYQIHVINSYIPLQIDKHFVLCANPFSYELSFGCLDQEYPNITISKEEAVDEVICKLAEIGIEDFYIETIKEVLGINEYKEYYAYKNQTGNELLSLDEYRELYDVKNKFYKIYLRPMYYGVPLLEANQAFYNEEAYNSLMEYEEIMVRLAEDSIAEFRWTNPTDISNVINDNVKIVSFETAIETAIEFMKLKYNLITMIPASPDDPEYDNIIAQYLSADVEVDEIKLGLAGIPYGSNSNEYLLIPVWNFYGKYSLNAVDETYSIKDIDLRLPIVTINGIDGSVIFQKSYISN